MPKEVKKVEEKKDFLLRKIPTEVNDALLQAKALTGDSKHALIMQFIEHGLGEMGLYPKKPLPAIDLQKLVRAELASVIEELIGNEGIEEIAKQLEARLKSASKTS
jgi:hypothetical protein